jgi:hypothetical protein
MHPKWYNNEKIRTMLIVDSKQNMENNVDVEGSLHTPMFKEN